MMDSRIAELFGRNVHDYRRHADLSQQALADLIGSDRVEVGMLERGLRLPRLDTILKLSAGVRASPCELLAGVRWLPGRYIEGSFSVEEPDADGGRKGS
jgi:transcriptional regulator with XRE-family HTH domain